MTQRTDSKQRKRGLVSVVSATYIANATFLERFLARFFSDKQDIEDVAQEAYLRAYAAEQRKDIEQPKAYLFRIAKNIALTQLTKKTEQITDYIEESGASMVLEYEAAADHEVEAQESLGLYCEAVARLPQKCRQVFVLRKVHGLAHKEIAERMSLSVSSVEKYLRRGVLECKDFVDECQGHGSGAKFVNTAQYDRKKGRR